MIDDPDPLSAVENNADEQPIEPDGNAVPKKIKRKNANKDKISFKEGNELKFFKKSIGAESFIALAVILAIFVPIACTMGFGNMLKTIFANALDLLINTCFYLMGVAVVIGALSSVMTEFGIISLANKALSPLMKPLYGMPGATSMAMLSAFLSDNPAVLSLADDKRFRRYFKKHQFAALTNMGTAFGMGLIVVITLATKQISGEGNVGVAVVCGLVGTICGSILSTRLMLCKAKKIYGEVDMEENHGGMDSLNYREVREGGVMRRLFASILDGGAGGVKVGISIIPGVLIIANLVMLLNGAQPDGGFAGGVGEGVGVLPWLGEQLKVILNPLFGFETPQAISVPITALGSAGAAIATVGDGVFTATEIAVFTAMCMFWSGYLSTHVAMMDSIGCRELTGSAILYHTFGGLLAGFAAHWLYALIALLL